MSQAVPLTYVRESLAVPVLDSGLFELMLEPDALAAVKPMLDEESAMVARVAAGYHGCTALVAVGDAGQRYRKLSADNGMHYVCVDPFLRRHCAAVGHELHDGVLLLRKEFGRLCAEELPGGNAVWFFHFNLFPYLDCAAAELAAICRRGDRVLIALWGRSTQAMQARLHYDWALARLAGLSDAVAPRTTVVVPLPKFERYRTIHGKWVQLHELIVGDTNVSQYASRT